MATMHTTDQTTDQTRRPAGPITGSISGPVTSGHRRRRPSRRRDARRQARGRHPSALAPAPCHPEVAHRTLALVDIENLCGEDHRGADPASLAAVLRRFRSTAGLGHDDLVVIGANPALAVRLHQAAPGCLLRTRPGPDGADLALLDELVDTARIRERFGRVVIGSGDHAFVDGVARLHHLTAVRTVAVARARSLSEDLRRCVQEVRYLLPA